MLINYVAQLEGGCRLRAWRHEKGGRLSGGCLKISKQFFPVLSSSHRYPSMVGALLCLFFILAYLIQSLLLLRRRLSLVADIVSIGCMVDS